MTGEPHLGGAPPVRAGILVTGTEVLTGIISDRNGPWLSERLREVGVDTAMIQIVGDRPDDLLSALRFMAAEGMAVIVTSGGLGPTADDLTAEIVGRFAGREMVLDPELEQRIADILAPMVKRWPGLDLEAIRAGNRKQAVIPAGATVLEPVGTAPGLVVPPASGEGPTVVVLPGPPRELKPMWVSATATEAFRAAISGATEYRSEIVRLFGIPESEIALTLRAAEEAGLSLEPLEITTCLRRSEIEVATRFEPAAADAYAAFVDFIARRHGAELFSRDGSTIDEQVVELLGDRLIAVAESCTGGLMAARLTERPGSSAYFAGGVVAYSNQAKVSLVGVDPALIERHGAVSVEVAEALALGAIERFDAALGIGITGVAGPDGGTEEKPVGTVCFSVAERGGERITRLARLPGNRSDIRDRSTTVALHLLRRLLRGETGELPLPGRAAAGLGSSAASGSTAAASGSTAAASGSTAAAAGSTAAAAVPGRPS
jgi:nicotinamide-nucleotide amidase